MFKTIPWLLLLLPLTKSYADQQIPTADPQNSDDESSVSNIESLSEDEIISPRSRAHFFHQCYSHVPVLRHSNDDRPIEQIPVSIEAGSLTGSKTQFSYLDDVRLRQGDKTLNADKMTYFIDQERAKAEGNVNFVSGELTLFSDDIETYLNTSQSTLNQADYQFHGQGGRGSASRINDNGADFYELTDSTYTACPPEDTTWSLDAGTLYIDNVEEVGSAYHAILRVKDVPVFYLPYVTYPLTDKRKTGVLFPTFEFSDTDGFSFSQPLYFNIAENMDATLTANYMQKRGTKLDAEYRYLFGFGRGNIQAEYLVDDKIRGYDRYLYHWDHSVSFDNNWAFSGEYTKVSDDDYFNDLDTDYGERSDNQLLQTAKLSYREENWNSELEVRTFQILGDDDDSDDDDTPHKVMPKLAVNVYQPLGWKSLELDLYSELSIFDHDDEDVYTGTRVHIEPKISLPLYYNSVFVNTELKYMLTYYHQSLPDTNKETWYEDLEENTVRYLPSFKVNSGVNFERQFTFLNNDYRQTLVPQVQYLYVPYQDQSEIGTYDTTSLQQDYYGLFRDNRYSGYDRIADANQITLGVSSSFLNSQGKERMRFAIGQNYYIEASEVYLPDYDADEDDTEASRSSIVGEFDMNFKNNYFYHAGMEWDSDNNVIKRANSTFEKRWLHNTFAQLSYRYLAFSDDGEFNIAEDEVVNQLGGKMNWSINSQWTAFASYYHDMEYNQTFESIIGIQYQSCCWSIGITYDEHMLAYYDDLDDIRDNRETEQSFKLNIELIGLGGVGVSDGDQGLFDYGRPFYLQ